MSKKKKKPERKGVHIYKLIRNTVLGVVIAVLTGFIILTMFTRLTGGTPTAFGYSMFRVSSGSMKPALEVGDVIITKQFDPITVKKGDIVTYLSKSGEMKGKLVTHRVIKAPYKAGKTYRVVTKGDANFSEDDPINVDQIQSKFLTKVSILKTLYSFFVTPLGLLAVIGLIIFAFFNEIVIFFKAIFGIGYEEEVVDIDEIIERYQNENKEENKEELPDSEGKSDDENNSGG